MRPSAARPLRVAVTAIALAAASPTALLGADPSTTAAAAAPAREQVERRQASIATLIESSSGARQIETSGIAAAQAKRAEARALHRQAGEALRGGDTAGASRLLDEAAKTMVDGVRLAAPEQVTARKDRSDFDARMESARALLEAQKRIAAEKGGGPRAAELGREIARLLADADALAAAGKVAEGRVLVDQAYLAAKAAIGGMREGDTLVRSLEFANKEEEFRYEVDRNDTHQMLVRLLLQDRRGSGAIDRMVERSQEEALRLRRIAEEQAARRDFDAGVKTMEESTRELVRAIRGAGVYIPG